MIAGALIAQRALDHDEIRRGAERRDLARRGHADEKPASRREQLLGEQHGKSGADRAADDAEAHRRVLELEQLGMIAGPARRRRRPAGAAQRPHDVAVRVEQADLGHFGLRQILSAAAPRAAGWPARTPKEPHDPCRQGSAADMADRDPGPCALCPSPGLTRQAGAQSRILPRTECVAVSMIDAETCSCCPHHNLHCRDDRVNMAGRLFVRALDCRYRRPRDPGIGFCRPTHGGGQSA